MAFVNERIPPDDAERYRIGKVGAWSHLDRDAALYWTIDRERNVHLRWIRERPTTPVEHEFLLFWQGVFLRMVLVRIPSRMRDGTRCTRWTFLGFEDLSPPEGARTFRASRTAVLEDLKAALTCYRDFGALSRLQRHVALFDF